MSGMHNRYQSKRLNRKSIVFEILRRNPELSAVGLRTLAAEQGVELTTVGAYRALASYRNSGGKLECSETKSVQSVAAILQDAAEGEHLTVQDILDRAALIKIPLSKATVYRVLTRLCAVGLVQTIGMGRQKYYEWKRDQAQHGHLTCVQCGRTIEFHQDYLDAAARQICSRFGYQYQSIEFIVRSLCARCRES